MPMANEIVARDHPNSVSNGTTRMPGLPLTPPATSNAANVTPATTPGVVEAVDFADSHALPT